MRKLNNKINLIKLRLANGNGEDGKDRDPNDQPQNRHDQRCFYRPFCMKMASECRGFHEGQCLDYMPGDPEKGIPAGPKHHLLPDQKEFLRMKREHDSPARCAAVKKCKEKKKKEIQQGKDKKKEDKKTKRGQK